MNARYRHALTAGARAGTRYRLALTQRGADRRVGAGHGRQAGSSLDFHDYRDYQPGDDLRRIDWGAYGRSDKLVVKLFREEIQPHVELLIDGSASMALPGTCKAEAALHLAAALATAATNAACSHRLWQAGQTVRPAPNGHAAPAAWPPFDFDGRLPLAEALAASPPTWRRQSVRIVVSDLLWLGSPLDTLRRLADGAAALVVLQVLGRPDLEPPLHGNLRLEDAETGETTDLFLDALAERRYRDALARHGAFWHDASRQLGATFLSLVAESVTAEGGLHPLEAAGILE